MSIFSKIFGGDSPSVELSKLIHAVDRNTSALNEVTKLLSTNFALGRNADVAEQVQNVVSDKNVTKSADVLASSGGDIFQSLKPADDLEVDSYDD